jgi:cytidylate kinase
MASADDTPLDSELGPDGAGLRESPLHGFRGEGPAATPTRRMPAALTIAISREAGARGNTIGGRAGDKLGWPVYNQGLLEYVAQEGPLRQTIAENLSPAGFHWIDEQLEILLREQNISQHPSVLDLARMVLGLGAQGEVVLIGRGAGCILPRESTLHVRIIAPREARIAYMSQWLRLTTEQAEEQVRLRDERRAKFLITHFHRQPDDPYQYDLIVNSALLGEETCADLIVQAARAKMAAYAPLSSSSPA